MLGIIGAGNMAGALARGWGEPVLATDRGSGRAARLVADIGGEVVASNAELVRRADTIILGHHPHQLEEIAGEVDASGKQVFSVLAPTTMAQLKQAYPNSTVARIMPNTPVQLRMGVSCIAEGGEAAVPLFERVGKVFVLPESQMNLGTATIGVTPAYIALLIEAMVDAAAVNGLAPKLGQAMFVQTLIGTAHLIAEKGYDTLAARREVATPGESTVRGVAALERCGIRPMFQEAMADVLTRLSQPYHG
ncbi:pyrroline-5-carboxylate reductase family protein [Sphingosinicella rhizophila]|uniref:Pyrroline-5-carboxylate reductase n=1 Tax=Sphingosinicella rhizophila TaxID=3050082 RepID=A0ABU3Q5N8_9SPHN|nr:pyrroline-5-carboxylate reductase dimerization domain-containing protein [Sphingosinicella sp. GR2756]MDT9598725.1 pyrroline-5-carboxylate reductase dimerization domain-containing protein [Sphingosinicella sp. GR2756]